MAKFQAPKGTRDLYPEDVLRQRYITQAWRDVSIRHGFDEIIGPTFEHLDIYKLKSGEGIVSELFSFRREGGDDDYALRPEFTPTLARMYAARARQLPQPTKWFTAGPYFRAEKPQRGRLREFLQWNVDVMGLSGGLKPDDEGSAEARAQADAETIACCVDLLCDLGLEGTIANVKISNREWLQERLQQLGLSTAQFDAAFSVLDMRPKLSEEARSEVANRDWSGYPKFVEYYCRGPKQPKKKLAVQEGQEIGIKADDYSQRLAGAYGLFDILNDIEIENWCTLDLDIVRGLAYYTGTVFEVIADGERAVCGGGRYDKLVELFGGPATPAVGFGMGDVVLSLLLDDKGLMPEGAELMEAASRPGASVRPEAFVIPGGDTGDAAVNACVAMLRRGPEVDEDVKPWRRPVGLHARRSYKSTRNVGKLLKDANNQHSKFAVILESADEATIKDLDTGEQSDAKFEVGDALRTELFKRLRR